MEIYDKQLVYHQLYTKMKLVLLFTLLWLCFKPSYGDYFGENFEDCLDREREKLCFRYFPKEMKACKKWQKNGCYYGSKFIAIFLYKD